MKKLFLLTVCFLVTTLLMAAPVTVEQARQKAAEFLSATGGSHRAPAQIVAQQTVLNAVDAKGQPYLYAFNVGSDNGFVIVSGDDRFRDVLGYSASGTFSNQDMPEHMKAWLQGYVDEMKYYDSIGYQPSAEASTSTSNRAIKQAIAPMLTTKWDQGEPYYNKCPEYLDGYQSVTGCVATAMAQVVYYTVKHSGKQLSTLKADIPGYSINIKNYGAWDIEGISRSSVSFDWDNMLNVYSRGGYTNTQANAVATLMVCCGKSVQMQYSSGSSGANTADVANALVKYFGFDSTAKSLSRDDYSYAQWVDLIYAELAAERPVQYGGQSSGGGHSFVIDGYDGDEMFHVNWGWSGEPDSYYVLSVLNPNSTSGIGASSSNDGYSYSQKANVGLQYGTGQTGEDDPIMISTGNFRADGATAHFDAFNVTGATHSFYFGIGFMDEEGVITPIKYYGITDLPNGSGWKDFDVPVPTDESKAGQTLKVVTISKEKETSTWYTGCNSDIYYFEAVYDASGVPTLTAHPIIDLETTSIKFTGSKYKNEVQPVEVTVKNNGDEFYGVLYLFASTSNDKGNAVNKGGITIQKNKTGSLTFEWTPTTTGTYNIWVATDDEGNNVIGTGSVTISLNSHAPAGPFVFSELIAENVDETSWRTNENGEMIADVYSTKLNFSSVKIVNATESSQTATKIYFRLYREVNGSWSIVDGYSASNITVNGGTVINFGSMPFDEVGFGTYLMTLWTDNNVSDQRYIFNLTMGYKTFAEDGTVIPVKTTSYDVTVAENVAAIDLSNFEFSSITPNSNPNTLYILSSKVSTPASLTGKNVVKGDYADQITLVDGHAFYSPVNFTAQNITYTRTETNYLDKDTQKGWTTLVLPFAPDGCKTILDNADYPLTWFNSAEDTNKNLWLMTFSDERAGIVEFGFAGTQLEANKPYIMALPGDSYGNRWSLTGLPIIFYATNAEVKANAKASTTGTNYKFVGTTVQKSNLENIYKLNADGNRFVKGTASIDPFRAYFAPTSTAATATELSFRFAADEPEIVEVVTAITKPLSDKSEIGEKLTNAPVYNMNGQRVSHPTKGLYIVNGKKVIIK